MHVLLRQTLTCNSLVSEPFNQVQQQYVGFVRSCSPAPDEDEENEEEAPTTPFVTTASGFPSLAFDNSAPSCEPDPHAVSQLEAFTFYAGLPSEPKLVYHTGEKWSPPKGPEAQRRRKELCEVFTHRIAEFWNHELGWKVVSVLDAHTIRFTTIDVVRFKPLEVDEAPEDEEAAAEEMEEFEVKKPVLSPVTIWIGVFPEATSPTAAHNAAQGDLALLKEYEITDVDVHFRESTYTRNGGPQLLRPVRNLHPLVHAISPLIPALGLPITTKARPNAQGGTMALYLAEGGDNNRLLGLTCRHVLFGSNVPNLDYAHHQGVTRRSVLLLGKKAHTKLANSIKVEIANHCYDVEQWKENIKGFEEREKATGAGVEEVRKYRLETLALLVKAEKAMKALKGLLGQVEKDWSKLNNRILGTILYSPAINLGVSEHRFIKDWAIFEVDRDELGDGFQGNKIDLGTQLAPATFSIKCDCCRTATWQFQYPINRLLPLKGTITEKLMRTPDTMDQGGEPCLLVVKNGNATGTTLGRANGVFSIVREYAFLDMSISKTSMEWAIISYDSKSGVFSEPGDSGSIIADICGRIGGMLTGSSGKTKSSDITYATPFWWLLPRIQAQGFPNAHLNVAVD